MKNKQKTFTCYLGIIAVTAPAASQSGSYAGHPLVGTWRTETQEVTYEGVTYIFYKFWTFHTLTEP